jgi:hypothetical protein
LRGPSELVEAADGFRASLAGTSLADLARTDRALAGFAGESVT